MSSSVSDPNESQNESETNFVTGHMIELKMALLGPKKHNWAMTNL